MIRETIELETGWMIDGEQYKFVEIKEQTLGDQLDAELTSENEFVKGVELLSRIVVKIATSSGKTMNGPLTMPLMRKLTARDLNRLAEASERIENRGRFDAAEGECALSRVDYRS